MEDSLYPVQFVSLGPGDPDLITLKALKALQEADIIFCASTGLTPQTERSRSADMLHTYGLQGAILTFRLPMSKHRQAAIDVYRRLYADASRAQREGKRVAIAVEGDAGIYASMHYVLELFEHDHRPVEQLCGISSFIAAAAHAHLHLIQQEQRLVVIPGILTAEELDRFLQDGYVPVIMKLSQCAEVVKTYMQRHPEHAYHYFENVSMPQACYTRQPEEILGKNFPYFSLMIIQ